MVCMLVVFYVGFTLGWLDSDQRVFVGGRYVQSVDAVSALVVTRNHTPHLVSCTCTWTTMTTTSAVVHQGLVMGVWDTLYQSIGHEHQHVLGPQVPIAPMTGKHVVPHYDRCGLQRKPSQRQPRIYCANSPPQHPPTSKHDYLTD
jgi:hypothetical protein